MAIDRTHMYPSDISLLRAAGWLVKKQGRPVADTEKELAGMLHTPAIYCVSNARNWENHSILGVCKGELFHVVFHLVLL